MFIWDTDVAAIIQQAVTGEVTGIFNVAGDGAMTVDEIAEALGKRTMTLPEPLLRACPRGRQPARASRRTDRSRRSSCSSVPCSTTPG